MVKLFRQTWALTKKTLLIAAIRFGFSTCIRAFVMPVIFIAFLAYARNLRRLILIRNGLGGDVQEVIDGITKPVIVAGKDVRVLENDNDLSTVCKQSLRGASDCYAVAVGNNAIWNYTLLENHRNDIQERLFPLQHAIDFTIAKVTENKEPIVPQEYIRYSKGYQGTIISAIGVTFLIGMIGVVYQLVGFMAMEREQGLSQLIEAMGGSNIARLLSYHLAFDIIYAPGWIVIGGILIIEHLLMGLALSSWSLFGAVFFKKAQLSGITVTIVSLLLGVVAQIMHSRLSSGAIAILGILFPPMNYLFFTVLVARFERQGLAVNLTESAPENPWALLVENWLYGVADKGRLWETSSADNAVEVRGFSKLYVPGFWDKRGGIFMRKSKRMDTVVAVNDLSLDVRKGSVVGLLGANGSGKTTTLESIVGLGRITKGTIAVSGRGKIGVCPQKNVLWDHLTVGEHVKIWNKLKCEGDPNSVLHELIRACDLEQKIKAQSRTLSGGQKRKLQLAIMFTGGSNICAVDEVSSGLDPLSRRKIWDIILEARGRCTIIHTTHFLDEADLLSDHIAILSKGQLKAEGSSVELKAKLGGGYRVSTINDAPDFEVPTQRLYDQTVYNVPDSATAGRLIHELEKIGIDEYHVNGPTIEDVFLKVAEDSMLEAYGPGGPPEGGKEGVDLYPGKKVGVYTQAWVMYRKRMVILRRNYLPTLAAVAIPIIAAGITMLLFDGYEKAGCSPDQINMEQDLEKIDLSQFSNMQFKLVVGPESVLPKLSRYAGMLMGSPRGQFVGESSSITELFDVVGTLDEFNNKISTGYAEYSPGGLFLRENEPTIFAFTGNNGLRDGLIMQNLVDNLLTNTSISMSYQELDFPWAPGQVNTLQFITYFGLAMAVFPAFFGLYPTIERTRQVRALHYSNGVRPLPLWFAYLLFDFTFVLIISAVAVIIFATSVDAWYSLGHLFVCMILYGLASTLLSYVISLYARTQLSAFAFSAGGQAVMFLLYLIAFLTTLTYAPIARLDEILIKVHWGIATITPVGNLVRALLASLNSFQVLCRDEQVTENLGEMLAYGGPITYLIVQCLVLFGVLLWSDSGVWGIGHKLRRKPRRATNGEEAIAEKSEVTDELTRVTSANDGLRVVHLTKQFGKNLAVDNVTFGVSRGEVFALLGPNGAGKTTTINMIRGDMKPDDGDIFVENISVITNRAGARAHLGVCPQFDAMDQMTVVEHLQFYARARGVENVEHNVREVMKAVGLEAYGNRMAAKLSGGNKRKLSLGVALMGNPTAVLLDEPSSGMDAASKRVMWKTLTAVTPGRSLILTTHSMEEADALASRVGILARRMLALGTGTYLRRKHGDKYHIHLVLRSAPYSLQSEMDALKNWILGTFPGAEVEQKSFHGQIRFSVPAQPSRSVSEQAEDMDVITSGAANSGGVSAVFEALEQNKERLGLEYYSIVEEANVAEEGYTRAGKK
ncbi:ABC transporter [Kalaharituber pfeilii]|nr:ABC transporter [Kalaharituber pfeilii]